MLFQLRVSTACERRSKPRLIAVSAGLYATGLGLVAILSPATAVPGLAVTICLVTAGEMLLMPVVPSFIAELSPIDRRGTYQGIAMAATAVGSGVGPPIAGLVLDVMPGAVLWLAAALILLGAAAGFLALSRWSDRLAADSAA